MLAFDLHGVIMYTWPAFEKYYEEAVGFKLEHGDRFNFKVPYWYNKSRIGPDIAMSLQLYIKDMKPMRGSIQALQEWSDKGNDIIIVTASANSTMDANKKWLDKWLNRPYVLSRVDAHEGKVKALVNLGCTHYVDDRYRTCQQLADHLKHVYLFDDIHNRGREIKENVTRVRSLRKVFNHYTP
jgi:hypothetical protein